MIGEKLISIRWARCRSQTSASVSEDIGVELCDGRSKFVQGCTPDRLFVVGDVAPGAPPDGVIDIEGKRERTLYLALTAFPIGKVRATPRM